MARLNSCFSNLPPFLNSQAVRPDWCQKDTGDRGGGPISSPIWQPPPPPCSPLGLLPDPAGSGSPEILAPT